jgi:hypothetical protein
MYLHIHSVARKRGKCNHLADFSRLHTVNLHKSKFKLPNHNSHLEPNRKLLIVQNIIFANIPISLRPLLIFSHPFVWTLSSCRLVLSGENNNKHSSLHSMNELLQYWVDSLPFTNRRESADFLSNTSSAYININFALSQSNPCTLEPYSKCIQHST